MLVILFRQSGDVDIAMLLDDIAYLTVLDDTPEGEAVKFATATGST